MSRTIAWISLFGLISASIPLTPALAQALVAPNTDAGFRSDRILEDQDIFGVGTMTRERVATFLRSKGALGTLRLRDIDGIEKPASDIIWRVSTSYDLNPSYLMALLQKEQSLVEDWSPSQRQLDWATGYGVCDSCSKDDPSIQDFKGFANQLEYAAKQHRERYLLQILGKGSTIAGHAPGKASVIDGQVIIPQNNATAMLYSYTPHIHGNLNLWRIWKRWFGVDLTDGTFVQGTPSNTFYLISFARKRPIASAAVAASLVDTSKIVRMDDATLTVYPDGAPIAFPNFSLIRTEDGKIYLLDGYNKRWITNEEVFHTLGFNEDEIIDAPFVEIASYLDGADITLDSRYPTGLLAKDSRGTYWYIDQGVRRKIEHPTLVHLYFRSRPAQLLNDTQLAEFPLGEPYRLHDGELVKTPDSSSIYVMEHGTRRPIVSGDAFEHHGWSWNNVITLPTSVLESYPLGEPIVDTTP